MSPLDMILSKSRPNNSMPLMLSMQLLSSLKPVKRKLPEPEKPQEKLPLLYSSQLPKKMPPIKELPKLYLTRMLLILLKVKLTKFWKIPSKELNLPISTSRTRMRTPKLLNKTYSKLRFYLKKPQPIWKQPTMFSLTLNLRLPKPSKTLSPPWPPTWTPETSIILHSRSTTTPRRKFNKPETKSRSLITLLPTPSTSSALPTRSMTTLNLILQLLRAHTKRPTQPSTTPTLSSPNLDKTSMMLEIYLELPNSTSNRPTTTYSLPNLEKNKLIRQLL